MNNNTRYLWSDVNQIATSCLILLLLITSLAACGGGTAGGDGATGAEVCTSINPADPDSDGVLDSADTPLSVDDMEEVAYLALVQGQVNDTAVNPDVLISGRFTHTTDRFGNAAAVAINSESEHAGFVFYL